MKIILVAGARPNFMKISPVSEALSKNRIGHKILHTGQHYDEDMSKVFFHDLGMPEPDIYLGVGSGTHAEQTGKIMIEFEKTCFAEKPDLVVVVGDVNSTVACALVASKLNIPVAHIEAGLRSFDRTMPEEINRILTDQISDFLFTTCEDANTNLKNEGIPDSKIHFVGNVMIDTLLRFIEVSSKSDILERLGLKQNDSIKKYAVLTLHRPSNVDDAETLKGIFTALERLSEEVPIVFPAHPRTLEKIEDNRFGDSIPDNKARILIIKPLGYLDFLCLMSKATIVLTDSGGIQEETTILGIPCLTLRKNTERPITVKEGTNIVVGNRPEKIIQAGLKVLEKGIQRKKIPNFWDGKAADRIVKTIIR
jgi:UDP-N-acetylglucosamine 2-epimerase (non-hydrolysing)